MKKRTEKGIDKRAEGIKELKVRKTNEPKAGKLFNKKCMNK
jgi:hypothetical protein